MLIKSRKVYEPKVQELPSRKPRSAGFDPQVARDNYASSIPVDRHPGTGGIPYDTCLSISRIPVIGSMIHTRMAQAAEFSRPQPDPYSVGFVIKKRGVNSGTMKVNNRDSKRIEAITEIISRAGGAYWPGGFDAFIRTIVPDSLTYDQVNFEVIKDKGGKPWGFVPVDPRTFRRAEPTEGEIGKSRLDPTKVSYVQFMHEKIVGEFAYDEIAWGIRRPRSDVRVLGYGWPEPEQLLGTVTNLLNAETFNAAKFNNGIAPRMILGVKSDMDDEMWQAFQRQVWATLNGVAAHGRVPLVKLDPELKEDIVNVSLNNEAMEMEYREWVNWLLKVVCAVYLMDPAEIGFVFGNEGQGSGLQNSSAADRVSMSREKGLRPLMRSIAYWLNEWVVYPFDNDYELEFVGFDNETEENRNDLDTTAVQNWATIDEIRASRNLEPLPDGTGKIILNATWMQMYMDKLQQEREEEMSLNDLLSGDMGLPESDNMDNAQPGLVDGGQDLLGDAMGGGEEEPLMASSIIKSGFDPRITALARLDRKTLALYNDKIGWMMHKIKQAAGNGR